MKLKAILASCVLLLVLTVPASANGFDQYGYNRTARVFVGPLAGWCTQHGWPNCVGNDDYLPYANDHLVMKWNAEWDRGNAEGWANGPYRAYLDNEMNGNVPGGSGWTEHFKVVWVGDCSGPSFTAGGYCIWGQFEAIFDRGMDPSHSRWTAAFASPAGYGSYP